MSEQEQTPEAENGLTEGAQPSDTADDKANKKTKKKEKKDPFSFTDAGCRTEVRLGALLTVAPVFLWLWLGPNTAVWILLIGVPLLWAGIPIQAIQSRKQQRPGFPWKLGIAFSLLGGLMIPDQMSQVVPGGPVSFQIQAPLLCLSGIWILGWWAYTGFQRSVPSINQEGDALHG